MAVFSLKCLYQYIKRNTSNVVTDIYQPVLDIIFITIYTRTLSHNPRKNKYTHEIQFPSRCWRLETVAASSAT
jgi:hypothetical protein